jgi:hypothetical protein
MKNMFRQVGYKLTNFIKYIMGFFSIFKKSNDYNEKVVIGFMSFMVMVIAIAVDLITGYMGKALELNEYIFDAFMYITLGSFLPDVLEKFAAMKNGGKTNNEE